MKGIRDSYRANRLRTVAVFAIAVLFLKILIAILTEYRWYFPANFESSFLSGRRSTFVGLYKAAFYAHIIAGPIALVSGAFLVTGVSRARFRHIHRWLGKTHVLIVVAIVAPSGFVMARDAYAGPVAAYGFGMLALATAISAMTCAWWARQRQFHLHQRWATRCFVLLCSPLLLRLISGAAITFQFESDLIYRLNAWLSWLVPLAIHEVWWRYRESPVFNSWFAGRARITEEVIP